MDLLLQLLPFLALASILTVSLGLYLWKKRRQRKPSQALTEFQGHQPSSVTPPQADVRAAIPMPAPTVESTPAGESTPPTPPGPAQIVCLHTMGIAPTRISVALGRPLQEVEIVLQVAAIRQSRLTPTPQLS